MNRATFLTKKRAALTLAIIITLAATTITYLQLDKTTTQAALIDPHPGLVAWYRFDEGIGTVSGDSSGNGNNGAIYGSANWGSGKYGSSLSFDGTTSHVEVPAASSLFPASSITIEFWVKISSANINSNAYMGFVSRNTRTSGLQVAKLWGSGRILFESPSVGVLISDIALTPDVWNHVACVLVSGSSATIYINGQQRGSNGGWALPTTNMNYWIGRAAQGTASPYFLGELDEVRIYNRALSAVEIQAESQQSPDLSSTLSAKIPQGTNQVITTLSWQGTGSINITVTSPGQTYTEDVMSAYQKTVYSTSEGNPSGMLNIKRLSISVGSLASDQIWGISLTYDSVIAYQVAVEVQK